ncbi:MAG TPA: hypothetical protein VGG74_30970 [Kofleriaceae bacterium]|jgi:hypothetical protein
MGLFGLFGDKKPLSPWQESLRQASHGRDSFWRDDNKHARAFVRSLLERAAPDFGGGKVVDGEPGVGAGVPPDVNYDYGGRATSSADRNLELHGTCDGVPLRVAVSIPAKRICTIEARCADTGQAFWIARDPARIPQPRDASDAWTKDQPTCVFLGKGIYFATFKVMPEQATDDFIPAWNRAPRAAQELLLQQMETLDLLAVVLSNDKPASLIAFGRRSLEQLEDPIAYMRSCGGFLAQFVKLWSTSIASTDESSDHTPQTAVCTYCKSIFVLGADHNTCPNCAPAS